MKKKIKIGVIGLGMGRAHIQGYRSHPCAEVVAIADMNKERLESISKEFSIKKCYENAQEMLDSEKLDVVSVVTPNKFHKPLTLAALKAGCHVLCEKPMAMNAEEAQEMLDAAKKVGKRLMINFSYRFTEQAMALKQQVDSGIFGDIYFGRTVWHRRRGIPGLSNAKFGEASNMGPWFIDKELAGGGPLIDLGVHRLDLALWLMGYPKVSWVMGSTYDHLAKGLTKKRKIKYTVEDLAGGMIKFENGATLIVEASWAANIKENELMETRLMGVKGGLVQRNINEGYEYEAEAFFDKGDARYDLKLHDSDLAGNSAYYHIVDCLAKDCPNIATAEEGLAVMKILDALYASAQTGKPIQLK